MEVLQTMHAVLGCFYSHISVCMSSRFYHRGRPRRSEEEDDNSPHRREQQQHLEIKAIV